MATSAQRLAKRSALGHRVAAIRKGRATTSGTTRVASAGRPPVFVVLLALVIALDVIGLVMVLSSSSVHALREYGSSWFVFLRQLAWVGVGGLALVIGIRVDYHRWARWKGLLLAMATALLVLVLVPGVGITVNGSTRWLGLGPFQVQPSELAKLALLVFVADLLARRADAMADGSRTVHPTIVVLCVLAGLVLKQPDMGTSLILGCIALSLLFYAGTPLLSMAKLLGFASGAALAVGWAAPYRRERLLAFLDPMADASNTGYQVLQARYALGSGHLTGVGLGSSRAKWGFLPNAHTDFIFAIIGEEVGLLGSMLVVMLFAGFAVAGVRIAGRAPDRFGMLLAGGITAMVIAQALINIGAVVGLLPVTGVPLPFVSFGGSSLVVMMLATGILANVARAGRPATSTRARG